MKHFRFGLAIGAAVVLIMACLGAHGARAQTFVVPGYMTTSGCPSASLTPCFRASQYIPAKPLGYCQLSVTTAAQTSTCSGGIPTGAAWALICNEGTAARWRDDGTAPTTTVGGILGSGTATAPTCANFYTTFSMLDWIAESGTSTLDITFYR